MKPSSKVHYVSSNRHVNVQKENMQKRPQRSTIQRAQPKKMWVLKSVIEEMRSKAPNEKSKSIWIPKSLLKDLNIENKSKLTFKLPKASTPSSSQHLPKKVSKPSPPPLSKIALLPHISKPQSISSIFPPSFHYPSRCVSMLILPNISSTLMRSSKSYSYLLSLLVLVFQNQQPYPPSTSHFPIISLPLPYQHLWVYLAMGLAYHNLSFF